MTDAEKATTTTTLLPNSLELNTHTPRHITNNNNKSESAYWHIAVSSHLDSEEPNLKWARVTLAGDAFRRHDPASSSRKLIIPNYSSSASTTETMQQTRNQNNHATKSQKRMPWQEHPSIELPVADDPWIKGEH